MKRYDKYGERTQSIVYIATGSSRYFSATFFRAVHETRRCSFLPSLGKSTRFIADVNDPLF